MSVAIAEAGEENERHADACMGASSMPGMMDELGHHEEVMAGVMMRMDDAREHMQTGPMMGMGHCSGQSFEHMSGGLNGLHSEMSGHNERMRAAATLDAAQSECATHTDEMRGMMQGMMQDLDALPCMSR
jgi:hypothetical protein